MAGRGKLHPLSELPVIGFIFGVTGVIVVGKRKSFLFPVLFVSQSVNCIIMQIFERIKKTTQIPESPVTMKLKRPAQWLGIGLLVALAPAATHAESLLMAPDGGASTLAPQTATSQDNDIWEAGIGEGFKAGAQSITLDVGALYGVTIFGGSQSHDMALASVAYGYMLTGVHGVGHWYAGNLEFRGELFGGGQFIPKADSFVGLTPHLRYDFATGTHWVPYLDLGAGLSATSISRPDLSGTFEFNLQLGTGVNWFIRKNLAIDVEARYVHFSDAGISRPNLGVNTVGVLAGVSWFF
jgi:lipid A 3-O-deacylase